MRWATPDLPRMLRVRQAVDAPRLDDVPARLDELLDDFDLDGRIHDGDRVAVAVGSRGIRDLVALVSALVARIVRAGGRPFIVPCMGSHGAATAEGQEAVLAELGITAASVGAPVLSDMDAVEIARSRFGTPVWAATQFVDADAIVVLNRVKPHTDFSGPIESGLAKMLVIGMGKHRGAVEAHRMFVRNGFTPALDEIAGILLQRLPVLCGLAVIENQLDETAELHVLGREEILAREPALLQRARELMPALPFSRLDCLVVDEIGKDISGAGMDTNVVGRKPPGEHAAAGPVVSRIFVRDLTKASAGNATGVGLADFTTTRLIEAIDRHATAINALTAMAPECARLPLAFERDVDAVEAAYMTSGASSPQAFRVAWIRNTLALEQIVVSEALADEVAGHPGLTALGDLFSCPVDRAGRLVQDWRWEAGDREYSSLDVEH